MGILTSSSSAQNADIPVVSIRSAGTATPEYCPPNADCVGLGFVLTRTGPRLDSPLQVLVFFGGTAAYGIDYEALPGPFTFAAGQDRLVLSRAPIDDTVYEGDETVQARLAPSNTSAANQYRVDPSNAAATVTILDNDPPRSPPVVSLDLVDGSATETLIGQNFADWAEFRVTRSGTVSNALDVFLHTDGTARLGEDYELDRASDGRTVRLPAGLASLNVRLWVIDDAFYEGDETALVRVVPTPPGVVGYEVDPARSSVSMVIRDNESPTAPLISIRATVPETREPLCDPNLCDAPTPAPGVFVVSRSGGDVNADLTVFLRYSGTASSGVDYRALPNAVVFRAGVNSVELNVEASHDTVAEGDETVVAELQPDVSLPMEQYRVDPAQAAARVVIHDNDISPEPIVSIEATDPIAEESSYPLRRIAFRGRFTVSRTGPTDNPLSVFVLYSGTATPDVDYPRLPWIVSIPAGTNKVEIEVVPTPDDRPEPIETVDAELSECPPLTDPPMGIPCHLVNIDPAKSRATVFIRDDGITTASLEITTPKDGEEFSVGAPIRIAATAIDLEGAITHVEFFAGDRKIGESTINFIREPDPGTPIHHEFEWRGAEPGSHVLTARAVDSAGNSVTSPPVRVSVGGPALPVVSIEATVPETTEPSPTTRIRPGVFTFKRTGEAGQALRVWVNYAGTATRGVDYEETPFIVEFPAGAASVEVLIGPLDDNLAEGDETVIGMLTPSPLAVLPNYRIDPVNNQARVVIHDNDADPPGVPVVSIRATQPNTAEPCPVCLVAPGVFTISRTGSTEHSLFVLLTARGTATPGTDYRELPSSIEIPAGRESVEVLVLPNDDRLLEGDETVIAILLPDPSLGPIERYRVDPANSEATVVIHDDESPFTPVVSIRATRPETQEPVCPPNTCLAPTPAPGVFTVSRRGGDLARGLIVFLRYGGSALPRADYEPLPESVEIPAGRESVELDVTAHFDDAMEGDETVVAALLPDPFVGPIERYRVDPAQASARVVIHDRTPPGIPLVTVVATDPFAREGTNSNTGRNTATFEVRRVGETNSNLTVLLGIGGTAANGVDYVTIPNHVTIPAGSRSARILVIPIDDNLREKIETVVVEVFTPPVPAVIPPIPPTYLGGGRAAAIIVDNDLPRPPCVRLPDGLFNVCIPVPFNDCFRVESTRDFKEWTPLCTVPVTEGAAHYVDPDASDSPHRFYRLVPVACDLDE
jgi:hypothetical protein